MTDQPKSRHHATTEQLRDAIDRGATGDKVPVLDPAAAPLGTDDEAAGTPVPADNVGQSLAYESGRHRPRNTTSGAFVAVIAVAVVATLGVTALAAWMMP